MRTLLRALVPLALVALLGCPRRGGGADAGSACGAAGSCNGGLEAKCTQQTCCQDYQGGFTADEGQTSCAGIHGTYSSIPCRATDLVGSCVLYGGTVAQQTVRYYVGYVEPDHAPGVESAEANCEGINGDFVFPPNAVSNGPCGLTSSSGGGGGGSSGGSGGGGPSTFSCNGMGGTKLHCYEYKNVPPGELAVLRSSCRGTPGTGCPMGGLVGCCTTARKPSGFTMETCYYAPLRAAQTEKGCALQGTWSSVP